MTRNKQFPSLICYLQTKPTRGTLREAGVDCHLWSVHSCHQAGSTAREHSALSRCKRCPPVRAPMTHHTLSTIRESARSINAARIWPHHYWAGTKAGHSRMPSSSSSCSRASRRSVGSVR